MKICSLGFILPVSSLYKFSYHLFWRFFSSNLWLNVYHYRIYHYLDFQMYFNYSSLLDFLKRDFVIFDHLFITIGFITEFILRCIFISLLIHFLNFLWWNILWSLITCLSLSDLSLFGFSNVLIILHCWFIYHFLWRKILWSLIICLSLSDLSLFGFSNVFQLFFIAEFFKRDFVIFDHLFITIGFITEFILRCIYNDFLLTL